MASMPNGHHSSPRSRGLPVDDLSPTVVPPPAPPPAPGADRSGRRLVIVTCTTILILWGALFLVFRDWRERYRARAGFGATEVAPVVDPLADIKPSGVDARAWREAVMETHAMLVSVTGANLLDLRQMEALREELRQTVARARDHPEVARDELAGIWNAMSDRAEFVLQEGTSGRKKGHPRPAILPPRPLKGKVPETGHDSSSKGRSVSAP